MLSSVYLRKANYAKVIETVNEFLNRHNDRTYEDLLRSNLAVAYSRNGELEKSDQELRRLDEIAKHNTETAYRLAVAYTDLGRNDEAISLLQKCFAARDDRLMWIKVEPRLDPLRGDPRFQDILRQMRLL